MNILVVVAHHDDLELGCGGTVARLVDRGHRVVSLVLTHSGYSNCAGDVIRCRYQAAEEGMAAARFLGYELIGGQEDTFDLEIKDRNICSVLRVIQNYEIDTIFTHWHGDTHPPHRAVNGMVMHASRNVSNVYGFTVNWHVGIEHFDPRLFVALEEAHWARKIGALKQYETEYVRAGGKWIEYLDRQSLNYGAQLSVTRAEGFVIYKSLWSI